MDMKGHNYKQSQMKARHFGSRTRRSKSCGHQTDVRTKSLGGKLKSAVWESGRYVAGEVKNDTKSMFRTTADMAKVYADSNDDGTQAAFITGKNTAKIIATAGKKGAGIVTYAPRRMIRKTIKKAAAKAVKVLATTAIKAIKAIVKAAVSAVSKAVTLLIASGGWIVVIILLFVFLLCALVVKFDVGWFVGGSTDAAQSNNRYNEAMQYVNSLQDDFNKQIRREAGSVPINDTDADNTNDILVTYICLTFDIKKIDDKFNDSDKDMLKDIFFTMCDYELDVKRDEQEEADADEEDEEADEKENDEKGKKAEDEVTSCTVTRHNLKWAINEYEFTDEQMATLQIISQLSNGCISVDGTRVAISASGSNPISGYIPDIGISVCWPTVSNTITSSYMDTSDRAKPHKGVDIAPLATGVAGDEVYACAAGKVTIASWNNETAGNYVAITHDGGLYTRYLHMQDLCVSEGDMVTKGQLIGHMGSTGDSTGVHLHIDFCYNGYFVNPMAYYNLN